VTPNLILLEARTKKELFQLEKLQDELKLLNKFNELPLSCTTFIRA